MSAGENPTNPYISSNPLLCTHTHHTGLNLEACCLAYNVGDGDGCKLEQFGLVHDMSGNNHSGELSALVIVCIQTPTHLNL